MALWWIEPTDEWSLIIQTIMIDNNPWLLFKFFFNSHAIWTSYKFLLCNVGQFALWEALVLDGHLKIICVWMVQHDVHSTFVV